jgi:hypothetical protein
MVRVQVDSRLLHRQGEVRYHRGVLLREVARGEISRQQKALCDRFRRPAQHARFFRRDGLGEIGIGSVDASRIERDEPLRRRQFQKLQRARIAAVRVDPRHRGEL